RGERCRRRFPAVDHRGGHPRWPVVGVRLVVPAPASAAWRPVRRRGLRDARRWWGAHRPRPGQWGRVPPAGVFGTLVGGVGLPGRVRLGRRVLRLRVAATVGGRLAGRDVRIVNPLVAVLLGRLILAEPVTMPTIAGGAVVVAAVAIVVSSERPPPTTTASET